MNKNLKPITIEGLEERVIFEKRIMEELDEKYGKDKYLIINSSFEPEYKEGQYCLKYNVEVLPVSSKKEKENILNEFDSFEDYREFATRMSNLKRGYGDE